MELVKMELVKVELTEQKNEHLKCFCQLKCKKLCFGANVSKSMLVLDVSTHFNNKLSYK